MLVIERTLPSFIPYSAIPGPFAPELALFFTGDDPCLFTITPFQGSTYRPFVLTQIGFVCSTCPPAPATHPRRLGLFRQAAAGKLALFRTSDPLVGAGFKPACLTPQGVSFDALTGTLRTWDDELALFRTIRSSARDEWDSVDVPAFRRPAGMRMSPTVTRPSELILLPFAIQLYLHHTNCYIRCQVKSHQCVDFRTFLSPYPTRIYTKSDGFS